VQCGIGRLGHFAGWKAIAGAESIVPDAVSWAKGLGGGLPIGSVWISARPLSGESGAVPLCDVLGPGSHGSTFGGGPLVASVALTVLNEIKNGGLIARASELGESLAEAIRSWNLPAVREVRGIGLMLGVVLEPGDPTAKATPAARLSEATMSRGLLVVPAGPDVIRLLPPLTISDEEAEQALTILKAALESL
jgi:acetylornithine/succinyldiaminopimelate/putrescine aminotransferase